MRISTRARTRLMSKLALGLAVAAIAVPSAQAIGVLAGPYAPERTQPGQVGKGSAPVPESNGIDWSTFGAGAGTGIAVLLGPSSCTSRRSRRATSWTWRRRR